MARPPHASLVAERPLAVAVRLESRAIRCPELIPKSEPSSLQSVGVVVFLTLTYALGLETAGRVSHSTKCMTRLRQEASAVAEKLRPTPRLRPDKMAGQVGPAGQAPNTRERSKTAVLEAWNQDRDYLTVAATQGWPLSPLPTTGNDEMRNRVAPMGTSVTFLTGWSVKTGLSCKTPQSPYLSNVHCGI